MAIKIARAPEPKPSKVPAERPQPSSEEPKRNRGRPPSGKQRVTLLLDPDVIAKFRATGPGWQARMNEALRAAKV